MTLPLAPSQRWEDASNRYTLENTVAPEAEPVTLDEAKLHMRVDTDDTDDDDFISSLITEARMRAENITRRAFVTSTWRFSFDKFPADAVVATYPNAYGFGSDRVPAAIRSVGPYKRAPGEFALPLSPFVSVESFAYTDADGNPQTLASDAYLLDARGYPATLAPLYGQAWPTVRQGQDAVQVTFIAGYGVAADVPPPLKAWIKIQVATLYRNREGLALFRGTIQELGFVDRLLDPFRIVEC